MGCCNSNNYASDWESRLRDPVNNYDRALRFENSLPLKRLTYINFSSAIDSISPDLKYVTI